MKVIKNLSLLLVVIWVSACASSVQLTEQDRAQIDSIRVSKQVVLPEEASYIGGLAAFGALGALAQGSSDSDRIKNYLRKNNIDVGQIVYEQFSEAAWKDDFLAARLNPNGKSVIELEVRIYGLGIKHGLSDQFKPMLGYYARMKNPSGMLVWEEYNYIGFDEVPTYTLEQYYGDPKYFRDAFGKAAKIIADGLMQKI